MEESGQPRVIWDHEHAVMASASSNLATQTNKWLYGREDEGSSLQNWLEEIPRGGSNPSIVTKKYGIVAQLEDALDLGSKCCGFDSLLSYRIMKDIKRKYKQ